MTFEEFQATRVAVPDVNKAIGAASDEPCEGFIYRGLLHIFNMGSATPENFLLVIGNQQKLSNDLTELERELYHYGLREGVVPETDARQMAAAYAHCATTADPAPDPNTVTLVAGMFIVLLHQDIGRSKVKKAADLNAAEPEDSGVCHSHDFCDANMTMLAAMEWIGFTCADCLRDGSTAQQLWNAAWDEAKKVHFLTRLK